MKECKCDSMTIELGCESINCCSLAIFDGEDIDGSYKKRFIETEPGKKRLKKLYLPSDNTQITTSKEYQKWKRKLNIEHPQNAVLYKYRPYLRIQKANLQKDPSILTFVLFNPSFANHFTLDDTIKNCAYITFKHLIFDGFEILNLLNIRDPAVDNIDVNDCNNLSCYDDENIKNYIQFKNVILAWGTSSGKNNYLAKMKETWPKFIDLKGQAKQYRALSYTKPWHLSNEYWNNEKISLQEELGKKDGVLKLVPMNIEAQKSDRLSITEQ